MRTWLRRRAGAIVAALAGVASLVACTTSDASPGSTVAPVAGAAVPGGTPPPAVATPAPVPLRTARVRRSPGVVAAGGGDAPYNYAPSVMADAGRYLMWWCSQMGVANPPGDDILYAGSRSLDGEFSGPDGSQGTPVFAGSSTGFDAVHVCDPSVIRVGGTYYMYYTGWGGEHVLGNAIGLATSPDGRVWTRAAGGRPIVSPGRQVRNDNVYGAGQPSAVYLDGWFHLMFTDTSGRGVGDQGIGQFLLRAKDPTFTGGVEALTAGGFRPVPDTGSRLRSVAPAFSADLMWVDALNAFAIAYETAEGTTIIFWDKDFRLNPYQPVALPGPWREGPGLVRRADGHAVVSLDRPCDIVPLDLVRGTREGPAGPTDLMRFGLDLIDVGACRTAGRAVRALDGFAIPSPRRTVDLIVGGQLVRVDRRSVAEALAVRILDHRIRALDDVPVAVTLTPGLPARRAPGRGVGLLIGDRLWVLGSAEAAVRNSSPVLDVTAAAWDSYVRGVDLVAPPR